MTAGAWRGYPAAMLYLASQSPRRHELLRQLGAAFGLVAVDVPEVRAAGESPREYVVRVAAAKAQAGLRAMLPRDPGAVVLGADTDVVLADRVFGKPRDAAAAAEMLRALSGRTHTVVTAVCCCHRGGSETRVVESAVSFAVLADAAIDRYIATGEPHGKAGAYAIQGRAAAFIVRLEGSYSGVVGLPLFETAALLARAGIEA